MLSRGVLVVLLRQMDSPAEHHDLFSCVHDIFYRSWGSTACRESMRVFMPRLLTLCYAELYPLAKLATGGGSCHQAQYVQSMCRQMCSA